MRAGSIKAIRACKAKRGLLGVIKRGARIQFIPALPMLARAHSFGTMAKGSKAQQVLADKAYASKANRTAMKGKLRGDILHKVVRG